VSGVRPSTRIRRQDGGFALIIVLWTLVLIAFIVTHIVSSGRIESRIAGNLVVNAVTAAAADGAVFQAIFKLADPSPERRWMPDGTAHELTIGDCRLGVGVSDEAGRINPSLASPATLEALLRATGSDPGSARRLALAIGEWVGTPRGAQGQEALLAAYRGAGLDYAPPGEPLETIGELRRVLGMTPPVFEAIRPHLSLFAPAEPVMAQADPVVKAAMAALGLSAATAPAPASQQSNVFTARITVIARGRSNARATRTAIVRIIPGSGTYTVLAWNSGDN
jgi:general secretion pathway protein K